ncbi:cupin-like domain-containing protein [Caulobacter sp. S45]|uniref:cupin-like domain-containing protein n=1 Tax=Caulobacter sp. S45 TaxID=1641861 RepID=UPI00131CE423|nr:cupin-like domain-containing protein [Caulobacter sp. S45]
MTGTVREIGRSDIAALEDFSRDIVEPCQPVVLRDVVGEWPAVAAARRSSEAFGAYLSRFQTNLEVEAFFGGPEIGGHYFYGARPDGFNFERRRMPFADALASVLDASSEAAASTVYIGSVPTEACIPGFAAENPMEWLGRRVQPRIWLGTRSNVSCHYDTLDNLACVVAGARRFTLFPPALIASLYVGPIDHTMAGQPVSLAASAPPGDPRFPLFEAARERALVVELGPGDALYLPKLWWHQVEATEPFNGLVNFWWDASSSGPDAPYATLLLAMIAISERPVEERSAWKAFFDHYVFRSNGHPLAHLPEDQHGMLGRLKPNNYGRIRARVMQMLRGA